MLVTRLAYVSGHFVGLRGHPFFIREGNSLFLGSHQDSYLGFILADFLFNAALRRSACQKKPRVSIIMSEGCC